MICGLFIGRFQAFQEFFAHVIIIMVLFLYFCKMIKDFAKKKKSLAGSFSLAFNIWWLCNDSTQLYFQWFIVEYLQ